MAADLTKFSEVSQLLSLPNIKNMRKFGLLEKNGRQTLSLFQACQTHASYDSDPGHRYKLRVLQVNRLSQVLAHKDKFRSVRTAAPAIVLKIALYQCHK